MYYVDNFSSGAPQKFLDRSRYDQSPSTLPDFSDRTRTGTISKLISPNALVYVQYALKYIESLLYIPSLYGIGLVDFSDFSQFLRFFT